MPAAPLWQPGKLPGPPAAGRERAAPCAAPCRTAPCREGSSSPEGAGGGPAQPARSGAGLTGRGSGPGGARPPGGARGRESPGGDTGSGDTPGRGGQSRPRQGTEGRRRAQVPSAYLTFFSLIIIIILFFSSFLPLQGQAGERRSGQGGCPRSRCRALSGWCDLEGCGGIGGQKLKKKPTQFLFTCLCRSGVFCQKRAGWQHAPCLLCGFRAEKNCKGEQVESWSSRDLLKIPGGLFFLFFFFLSKLREQYVTVGYSSRFCHNLFYCCL